MAENLAGALAYVTIIPAIIFLVLDPYNKNRFVRFHAFQSLFFQVAWIALWMVFGIFGHVPLSGWASVLLWPLVGPAGFILWLVLVLRPFRDNGSNYPLSGTRRRNRRTPFSAG